MSIRPALASTNPLENISCQMGEEPIQKIFSLLYAAILEVNSAGTGILFDRFTTEEIETIYTYYNSVGALLFCHSIDKLRNYIKAKLGEIYSDDDYFDLCETKEYIKIDKEITLQYQEMVDEMEIALIKFAEQNLDLLEPT